MCDVSVNCYAALRRTSARSINITVSAVILLCSVTAQMSAGQQTPNAKDDKVEKEFYTAKDRLEAIRAASIYTAKPVANVDIMAGPEQDKSLFQLHPFDKVICDFVTPGSQMGGNTPKFGCKITSVESANGKVQTLTPDIKEEPVKVKFGSDDNEVFAEAAASRLIWALGFYTDAWFSVKVECHNCPADVKSGSGAKSTRLFDPALIVRKTKGHKMYEIGKEEEGWSWKELADVNGRPTYEKDALALLGAFLVHSDNKPPQQRLTCEGVKVDESTHPYTTTCGESKMVVQDVGATFGGGGMFTSNDAAKMNLQTWSDNKLWKKAGKEGGDCPPCQARLRKSLTAKDGLEDPMVSEEGRRFLAGLMCQLSDEQIGALFRLARVAQMPRYHNGDGSFKSGLTEDAIVQQWVVAFKAKREDMAAARCSWKTKPADLKVIDNPAGLATVPNYCTARPY